MKDPFDRIVGPNGIWKDDGEAEDAQPIGKLNDREEFALRCLNAAANLYGVVTMEEFVRLYNGYAKNHAAPRRWTILPLWVGQCASACSVGDEFAMILALPVAVN